MRTVRVSIVRGISMPRLFGLGNAIAHLPQDRQTPGWAYPGIPQKTAVGRARYVCMKSPRAHGHQPSIRARGA